MKVAISQTAPRENRPLPDVSLTDVHVLVVDDEVDARELVKRLLEMAGATVSLAGSASEAMERILAGTAGCVGLRYWDARRRWLFAHPAAASPRGEPRERLARGRADRICAIGGSHESHPFRFSESSLEARGTCRVACYRKQPGRSQGQNSARRQLAVLQELCRRHIICSGRWLRDLV